MFAYDFDVDAGHLKQRALGVQAWIERWLRADAFRRLAARYANGQAPRDAGLALDWWNEMSTSFDYRFEGGYRERWQTDTDASLTSCDREGVLSAATELGLVAHQAPRHRDYSAIIVLGAGRMSPLLRCEYAAALLKQRTVSAPSVYLLGSVRPLDRTRRSDGAVSEFDLTRGYAPLATNEIGLVLAAARATFHLPAIPEITIASAPDVPGTPSLDRWSCSSFRSSLGARVHLLCARRFTHAPDQPASRPNTADTYELLRRFASPRQGERVLMVTTQLFVPFQAFDAMRVLGLSSGISVEVVGFPNSASDRPLGAEALLQEIRSALRSARLLWRRARAISPAR